ncbi:PREDICTED: uncharacterized protein LOC105853545 [Condylura cristata]|uniref:uncharacterized protein LOC105853545 n=1 Tax=Condylura cristata TaxID=143302 RepID=UPI000642C386|nr:PREDICTED: uncharacterized protein LOC105853545 [Condylura cristata]
MVTPSTSLTGGSSRITVVPSWLRWILVSVFSQEVTSDEERESDQEEYYTYSLPSPQCENYPKANNHPKTRNVEVRMLVPKSGLKDLNPREERPQASGQQEHLTSPATKGKSQEPSHVSGSTQEDAMCLGGNQRPSPTNAVPGDYPENNQDPTISGVSELNEAQHGQSPSHLRKPDCPLSAQSILSLLEELDKDLEYGDELKPTTVGESDLGPDDGVEEKLVPSLGPAGDSGYSVYKSAPLGQTAQCQHFPGIPICWEVTSPELGKDSQGQDPADILENSELGLLLHG